MRKVYAVRQVTGLGEPVAICESRDEALLLAEHVAYIDVEKGQTVEDYVFELPYIPKEPQLPYQLFDMHETMDEGDDLTWRTR